MREYENMGHMQRVAASDDLSSNNYLPHHAVIKEASTTTKLRVVFDAARKTSNGKTLNNNLMVGTKLQDDLFNILLRWRTHKIAITGDVEKMHRQILVKPCDAEYQRIVWRENPSEPIKDYK